MIIKALRIGIYSISGVGKSTLIQSLNERYSDIVSCIDGSSVIDAVVPEGLSFFKKLSIDEKYDVREKAVGFLQEQFQRDSKHMVIAGHYSFLTNDGYDIAWTKADSDFYDVIIFLDAEASVVYERCQLDNNRQRNYSLDQIKAWRDFEYSRLKELCKLENRPFYVVNATLPIEEQLKYLIQYTSESVVRSFAFDIAMRSKKIVVCDCDGTLSHDDVLNYSMNENLTLQKVTSIFQQNEQGYSFHSFWLVSLYLDQLPGNALDDMVDNARNHLIMDSVMDEQLTKHVSEGYLLVAISCGYPDAWTHMLESITQQSSVLGGASFLRYGCLITDQEKKLFLLSLKEQGCTVIAYGNSSSDIPMLKEADQAYFVYAGVLKERYRTKLQLSVQKHIHLLEMKG